MQIEEWTIDKVIPYQNNPRDNQDAVIPTANSIKQFGFNQPIVVDADGVIIAGHTRLKAAKHLGLETVPVLVKTDFTTEQAKAYRLADNKPGELSAWIDDLLMAELAEIESMSMSDFGFDVSWEDTSYPESDETEQAEKTTTETVMCPHCGKEFEI